MELHAVSAPQTYLTGVMRDELAAHWPLVEGLLQKPLTRMRNDLDYSTADIRERCEAGKMQLWIVHDTRDVLCAVITQIEDYPQRKVLSVVLTGSVPHTMDGWLHHLEEIKAWGREQGCEALRVNGRKGWAKVLRPDVVRTLSEMFL